MRHGVARLQRGDDALGATQVVKRLQRFVVGDAHVLGPADVLQEGMLRPHAGVIQAGRDRMGLGDLPVRVLQKVSAIAMQHAGRPCRQRRRVAPRGDALPSRFNADQSRALVRDVRIEDSHRVAATAHAGNHCIGLAAGHLWHLDQALVADHTLEVAHHGRVRMRPGDGTDDVEGVFDVGDPVAQGFVQRILQRLRAALDGHHGGAEQMHPVDVRRLAFDVLAAHVDHAFHSVACTDGGGGHAVLTGTCLGNDARLAHAARQQRLSDGVVDLVGSGVVEVLALEVDLRPAQFAAHAGGVVDRTGAPDEMGQLGLVFGHESRVALGRRVGVLQFVERVDEGLSDKGAAVGAEVAAGIGLLVVQHGNLVLQDLIEAARASAALTASQNRRIAWASLMPLADSTPELTSTAQGRT